MFILSSALAQSLTLLPTRWFPEGTLQYKLTQAHVIYEL